jgi:hypothetical protein
MARRETYVTEEKLQILLDNWKKKETGEIARMVEADEASVNRWAVALRRCMKKHGLSSGQINEWLPTKRRIRRNVYDIVAGRLLSAGPARRKRGRKAKGTG